MVYKDKEKQRAAARKRWPNYFAKNHDKILAQQRARYKRHPRQPKPESELSQEKQAIIMRERRKRLGKLPNGNVTRSPKMANAQNKAIYYKAPLEKFCELCPEDDKRPATQRHHPDYNYPLIFVSVCASCHKIIHISQRQQLEVTAWTILLD